MQTKISVVIPTYNRPSLLTRCLRSLSRQSLDKESFEVIVISDGPDPDTSRALRPWLRRTKLNLTFLSTEIKKGPAASRNLGWLNARARLIAFTDDDCIPAQNWLQTFLNNYNDQQCIAFSGYTRVPLSQQPTDFALTTARLQEAEFITANCACTKQALILSGGFDERFKLAWREDSDLHFKLIRLGVPIVKLSEAEVIHPVRDTTWGISLREQKKSAYEALLFRKYPDLYRSKIGSRPLWNYYAINLLWMVLIAAIATRQTDLTKIVAVVQAILLLSFACKRLHGSSKSLNHIFEMLSTSMLIPSLSIYWRIYGAFKYRVLFI